MIAVDTNILVYAHRAEFSEHGSAREALMRLADGKDLWGIPVFCLAEFLRVVTHPAILHPPTTLDKAMEALEVLITSPTLRILFPGEVFVQILLDTLRRSGVAGNLIYDAQIAALCLEHSVRTLLTNDSDFSHFEGLETQTLP